MEPINVQEEILLTNAIKNGDEQAFDRIYYRYHKQLYTLAYKYLKDPDNARDAVQDIFSKLWTYRERLNESLSIKGFLFISMKNYLLNSVRDKAAQELKKAHIIGPFQSSLDTEAEIVYNDYNELVEKGISQLSRQKQVVFRMRTFEGMNNDEVSGKLGVSINTVKFQFSQAIKFLRDFLKKHTDISGCV